MTILNAQAQAEQEKREFMLRNEEERQKFAKQYDNCSMQ